LAPKPSPNCNLAHKTCSKLFVWFGFILFSLRSNHTYIGREGTRESRKEGLKNAKTDFLPGLTFGAHQIWHRRIVVKLSLSDTFPHDPGHPSSWIYKLVPTSPAVLPAPSPARTRDLGVYNVECPATKLTAPLSGPAQNCIVFSHKTLTKNCNLRT
jgi:hypothetical protein